MKYYLSILYTLLILVGLNSCDSSDGLEVKEEHFANPIEQRQNLVFAFNKDIYPDSMLNKWDSIKYVSFTPEVAGSFKWNSSSELVFSPANGFLPETEYEGNINNVVTGFSKKKYKLNSRTIKFRTVPLTVVHGNVSWTRGQSLADIVVQIDIDFNYDVDVTSAMSKIKITSKNGQVVTTTVSTGIGKRVSLQFVPLTQLDEETAIEIHIDKGITIAEGKVTSSLDTNIEASVPSRFNLAITNISSQHTGEHGIITINTSQPLKEEGLKKLITLQPVVPFEIEATESSIILTGDKFSVTGKYEISISRDVEGIFGGKMKEDFVEEITFQKLAPSITFTNSKGMYLSTKGNRNIALKIVSVPKVKVTIYKVYENNIEHFMRSGASYGWDYDEEAEEYRDYNYYNTTNYGDEIFSQEYETVKLPRVNAASVLNLDFTDKIKGYNGTYIVKVESTEEQWIQESRILNFSDIGLIIKEESDNIYVFANSIRHATPMQGVKIAFISTNNQVLDEITTDDEGLARLPDIKNNHPGFRVGLVTAKKDGEFSFISLDRHGVETSRYDVGGRYPNATGLNAMIYAERNLYRPGERVNVSAIVRTESWQLPGEMPVKLQLTMPNGKEFATNKKILNSEGACETAFDIPPTALTGTYTLNVYTGNDVLLNSYPLSIEDFIPDRIKSTLALDKTEYSPGDTIMGNLQVDNLFGTPAAGRNFDAELNIDKKDFQVPSFPDYSFEIKNKTSYFYENTNGTTDEKGAAKFSFAVKKEYRGTGVLQGNIMATAFDETGRPVHRYNNFTVYTQPVFIGIKANDHYVSTRTPQRISLVAVDKTGKVKNNIKVNVTLLKRDWHTVIQQSGNGYRYVSQKEEKVLKTSTIVLNGQSSYYSFTPDVSGEYEVRVSPTDYSGYVSQTVYAWGHGDTHYSSFEVNNEGNVTIKTDKEKYNVGEDIKILFTTPFDGRMLVTLERNHVLKHIYLDAENKSASYTIKADENLVPNIYVAATLFRPMDDSPLPLTVAHGYKSISVENKKAHLPVSITATGQSRSKTKQKIKVKTTPGAFVTIAAVDEGILQVKNYKTPDPYEYFYQKVALSTNSYDVYPFLMPEVKTRLTSTGGDGADESAMRVNPLFVNRVKNVSFWSGIKQADGSGNVEYEIDVPQFSGDLRLMALAYKGNGFGSVENHMKVADPIVISTALPRFLSPGDEVKVGVTISNTTAKESSAAVNIRTTGPLGIVGETSETVKIKGNGEQRMVFNIAAKTAIGAGTVIVSVKAINETFINETEIGVRPPAGLQKKYITGQVNAGSEKSPSISNDFLPVTVKGKLLVSKSPLSEFSKDINDLVRYPHGCLEQTTSAVFPQLYYHDLVLSLTGDDDNNMNPGYNVRQAILKLQSMQMSNGALSYWPGSGSESWWGTIYAMHFLLEAKKAGFPVNAKTLNRIEDYLVQMLKARKTTILRYNQNQSKEVAAKEVAYSLFVLALADNAQHSTMNYYKAHPSMLAVDSKYLLAGAYALSGQRQKASEVLPKAFGDEKSEQAFGGSFYSYMRDLALSLYVLQEINPDEAQVPTLAKMLSENMRNQPYLNTQEKSFGILALGKLAKRTNKTEASATVSAGGKTIATTAGKDITLNLAKYLNLPLKVRVNGKGAYYYFGEVSGITADGSYKEEDSYLRVRRAYYTRAGKLITDNTFRQNELVIVKLTLDAQYSSEIENVVVTDILPAGLEIENTRLNNMPDIEWIKKQDEPDYIDFRDDRVNIYTSAGNNRREFYYMVRAVSPGRFKVGPVQADAMYNGAFHSYHGAGTVEVK